MAELKRFYREGRKVFDRDKSSHGELYCEARSNHAAEIIQYALNSWHGMGPARTLPKWIKKRIAKRKATKEGGPMTTPNQPGTNERETACANCDGKLYQTADSNNIHWYHEGTGDVRCPTRFAEPRAAVAGPREDAIGELFALMTQNSRGEWCFNSLSEDWLRFQGVMKRLAATSSTTPAESRTCVKCGHSARRWHGFCQARASEDVVNDRVCGCECEIAAAPAKANPQKEGRAVVI